MNGRPNVRPMLDAVIAGNGQDTIVMFVVAVAPQAAGAVIVAVPAAAGVPEMMFPASVRPAGRSVTLIVAPTDTVIVERNGRPTVPMTASVTTVGAVQPAIVTVVVATAPHAAVAVTLNVPASVGVPEITLPLRVRPAGSESTVTVAPGESASVERNGSPTVPVVRLAVTVGSGQAPIGMSTETEAPQGAVTVAWIVPVAVGVPVMRFPLNGRPAGRPVTASVAPGVSVNAVAKGSPTVPVRTDAVIVGRGHGSMGMSMEALAPQGAVTVAWIVPAAVGVPVMRLPLRVRPAGRPVTARVAPGAIVKAVAKGRPVVPVRTLAAIVGTGQASTGMSSVAVAPQAAVAVT